MATNRTELNAFQTGLTRRQMIVKRAFDLTLSLLGLLIVWPIILIGWVAATASTRANGFYIQQRVGLHGRCFWMIKLRSMRVSGEAETTVTAKDDPRITRVGKILRKLKVDELPQLMNVVVGHMAIVGPRPDVPGFADQLKGEDRLVLTIRPGITGPASIAYRNEESLLAKVANPDTYNRQVIWPDKVKINLQYIREYSIAKDVKYIFETIVGK